MFLYVPNKTQVHEKGSPKYNLETWPGLRSVARVGAEVPEPQQPTILQTFVDRYSHFVIVFAIVFVDVGGWIFNLFPPEPGVAKLVKSLLQECVVEEIPVDNKSGQSLKISTTLFQDKKLELKLSAPIKLYFANFALRFELISRPGESREEGLMGKCKAPEPLSNIPH